MSKRCLQRWKYLPPRDAVSESLLSMMPELRQHYGLNGGPHAHRPWSALRHRHNRRPLSRDWRSAQHWRAPRSEHAMAFAQCTVKRSKGEEMLAYVKECDAESGDGAPLYTQHGRVERFSSGYWEYREVPASCAQGPREGQGRRRDGHRLRSSFLCRWPPLSPPPCAVWADGSWPAFRLRLRGVSVSRTGAGLVMVSSV